MSDYLVVANFLIASDRGILRLATTERDTANNGKLTLNLAFANDTIYEPRVAGAEIKSIYALLVAYIVKHGYNRIEYFEGRKIHFDLVYGDFCRDTNDLKHDLGLFEPDVPIAIDLNHEAEKLGLSRADALKILQRAAAEACDVRKPSPRLKWGQDSEPDENPAAFAWRAYQAEVQAGTLHMGIIRKDDKQNGTDLAIELVSWLRSPVNRQQVPQGFDIPAGPSQVFGCEHRRGISAPVF